MSGQESFRRFVAALENQARRGGGGGGPPSRGFFAGSGLLIALVAGGVTLNAALFNGGYFAGPHLGKMTRANLP